MNRSIRLLFLALLQFSLFIGVGNARTAKPNFVFLLVDDLGWMGLGCYGSDFHETPNRRLGRFRDSLYGRLRRLACLLPHSSRIMTGRYPSRVDITDWIPGLVLKQPKLSTPRTGTFGSGRSYHRRGIEE